MHGIEKINEYLLSETAKIKSLPPESLSIENHILYDLFFDSVDLIDLITAIENDLNITIDDNELGNFTTLRSISEIVFRCSGKS